MAIFFVAVFKGTLLARYNYTSVNTNITEPNPETLKVFTKDNALYINWYTGDTLILIAKSGKHSHSNPGQYAYKNGIGLTKSPENAKYYMGLINYQNQKKINN